LNDSLFHSARARQVADLSDHGRRNFEFVAAHRGHSLRILATEAIALDRPLATRAQFIVARPFVDDRRVRERDVRHVGRFDHDGDVPFGGNDGAPDFLRAKFVARNERVLVRPDIVIAVCPIVDAAAPIEARLGRQRRPADVILARSPRNPGRRPFIARHPDPADATQPQPATVVVSRPPERLLGNPGPTGVAINPAAFGVRPPIALFRFARLPDVTVIGRVAPLAVGIELFVKHSVSSRGSLFRTRFGSFGNDWLPRGGDRLFGWCRCRRCRFSIGEGFFARLKSGLVLREPLLLRLHTFRGEAVLHLPLDLGFSFFVGLLFLAGNKKRQGRDQRENGKLSHGVIRHCWSLLIRRD
jgi:hypothetical protein